ncbi:hypothetical protein MUK42_21810 [Musa troglodytarum]|uniref:Uncharacterized protein n=1 Tax=Musa troglodytarum TaxID=320322 RepID=A0A9E7EMQ2_9LILI|nr:hypothetical protein MUK42_21810 [Musa troglodytarum]
MPIRARHFPNTSHRSTRSAPSRATEFTARRANPASTRSRSLFSRATVASSDSSSAPKCPHASANRPEKAAVLVLISCSTSVTTAGRRARKRRRSSSRGVRRRYALVRHTREDERQVNSQGLAGLVPKRRRVQLRRPPGDDGETEPHAGPLRQLSDPTANFAQARGVVVAVKQGCGIGDGGDLNGWRAGGGGPAAMAVGKGVDEGVVLPALANIQIDDMDLGLVLDGLQNCKIGGDQAELKAGRKVVEHLGGGRAPRCTAPRSL